MTPENKAYLTGLGDDELLALLIFGEARGESLEGQEAVAWVVRNRVKRNGWFGIGYRGVMLKPYQFSCFNEKDPNLRKLLDPTTRQLFAYTAALDVARKVLAADIQDDPTDGATSYHAGNIRPYWAKSMVKTCEIGHHIFYKTK